MLAGPLIAVLAYIPIVEWCPTMFFVIYIYVVVITCVGVGLD